MGDLELVQQAQAGDKEAFGKLVEQYETLARRISLRLVGNPEIASELVQEALLEAYLSLKHLREPAAFKSWFYGLVLNICRSHLRNQNVTLFSLDSLAGGVAFERFVFQLEEPDPTQIAEARELHRTVLNAVSSLSPKNRVATLLFYYDGLSLTEIATVLSLSVAAVKGRLHNSRNALRTSLLAVYQEHNPTAGILKKRSNSMVKVTIMDVVPSKEAGHYVVVLKDESGERIMPLWISKYEGEAIGVGLSKASMLRPMTFDFMANIINAVGARLEEVRIDRLKDTTFFATAYISVNGQTHQIDARPSDALALAVRTPASLVVAEDVFEAASYAVPSTKATTTEGKGVAMITDELNHRNREWISQMTAPVDEEKSRASLQTLQNYLFEEVDDKD